MFTYLQSIIESFNESKAIMTAQPITKPKPGVNAVNLYCSPRDVTHQMIRLLSDAVEEKGHYLKHFEAPRGSGKNDNFYISDTAPSTQTVEQLADVLSVGS